MSISRWMDKENVVYRQWNVTQPSKRDGIVPFVATWMGTEIQLYIYTYIVKESESCSIISDFATPWTVACQTPLSMELSRPEYWSRYCSLLWGSSQPRDWTQVTHNAGRFFTVWDTMESHICIFKSVLFLYRLLQNIEHSSLCYTVGPCWLSILYTVVCIC